MALITTRGLGELIGLIHDAGLKPALWPESLERIQSALKGTAALLFTPQHGPDRGGIAIPCNLSTELMTRYAEKYRHLDVWTQAAARRKLFVPGKVVTDKNLVPRQTLLSSPYFREFLEPANISRLCTSVIFGQDEPGVLPTVISIYRGLDAPPFSLGAKRLLRLLVPHLARSLSLMYRLRCTEQKLAASLATLDKLSCGIVLFDRHGEVLHTNAIAGALLEENDGAGLEGDAISPRRLTTASQSRTGHLNQLIASAVSTSSAETCAVARRMQLPRSSGRAPVVIDIAPLPPSHPFESGGGQALAIGFLFDSTAPTAADAQLLGDVYGLTPAEARLVHDLCGGLTLGKMGEHHGVSTETLKSQLKSIFSKTGVHRQIELVRLAGTLAVKP